MVGHDAVEAGLDIRARDSVERAAEPVTQVALGLVAVELVGALRAVGIGRHVVLEGISERGHAPGFGAFLRRIVVADLAQDILCLPPRLVGRHLAVAADDDALVGRLLAAVAGAVVDDEGLGAAGMNTDAEAGELAVPGYRVLSSLQHLHGGRHGYWVWSSRRCTVVRTCTAYRSCNGCSPSVLALACAKA